MKLLLMLLLVASPAIADDTKAIPPDSPALMGIDVGNFEEDAESVYSKLRRLMFESREKRQVRRINEAIAKRDPETAQKELDTLVRDYPDLKKEEPQAIEFHQATINFWKGDLNGAYEGFNQTIKEVEQEFPNGIVPRDHKYWKENTHFLAKLYFGRGATELHLQKYAQAILDINKAISVSPEPMAYMQFNKCRALLRIKKYKDAAEAYNSAYKIDSTWATNIQDKGEVCTLLEKNGLHPQPCLPKK